MMARRSRIWLAVATVFMLVNLGGGAIAALSAEGLHTGVHVVLAVVGVWWMWRIVTRARASSEGGTDALRADQALDHLQQSVDAIALEVERIGEASATRRRSSRSGPVRPRATGGSPGAEARACGDRTLILLRGGCPPGVRVSLRESVSTVSHPGGKSPTAP